MQGVKEGGSLGRSCGGGEVKGLQDCVGNGEKLRVRDRNLLEEGVEGL